MKNVTLYSTTGRKHLYSLGPIDRIMVQAVGEGYLEYRELWKKVSSIEIEPDFPPQLDIELSSTCNYYCPMCPQELRNTGDKVQYMSPALYRKIVDEGIKRGLKAVNLNYVNEPLLRNTIANFVAYAREKGVFDVMFNSNGLLLTKEIAKELILSGLTKLSISLDAVTDATYKKLRYGGDFKKVLTNIENFLAIRNSMGKRLPLLKLTFLMSKYTFHEKDDFWKVWKDKADLISIQNLTNPFDGQMKEKVEDLMGINCVKIGSEKGYKCPQPFQRMVIRHDGTVLACCHFRGSSLVLGNANNKTLGELYHGELAQRIRNAHMVGKYIEIEQCVKCIEGSRLQEY